MALLCICQGILADPLLPPGDLALRNDLELLVDAGVLRMPIMTWPMSWRDVARALAASDSDEPLAADVRAARERVRLRVERKTALVGAKPHLRLSAAAKPRVVRTFEDTPREEAELEVGVSGSSQRFSYRVQATGVVEPDDGQDIWPDGSYVGAHLGPFLLAVGYLDRWWGPGWDGSSILSTNPRPMPALSLDRMLTAPPEARWLAWLGPWRLTALLGQMEGDRDDVSEPLFFGLRFAFRPTAKLELALSRTAQWCGDGRPCDLGVFSKMLLGKDNATVSVSLEREPGNQLAGLDLRYSSPIGKHAPYALYAQVIHEDNSGGVPKKALGLYGVEFWGAIGDRGGGYRAHVEFADTACAHLRAEPVFDCAYNHAIFNVEGYRYRGRSVGHSLDNDAQVWAAGVLFLGATGQSSNVLLRWGKLNRGGSDDPRNTVTSNSQRLLNLELSHYRPLGAGNLGIGLGLDELEPETGGSRWREVRAFAEWRHEF